MFKAKGKYKATLIGAELGATQDGEPKPSMTFKVTDEEGNTETFYWTGSLNQEVKPDKKLSAADLSIQALVKAGFTGSSFDDLRDKGFLAFMPVNDLTVTLEEYKGKLRVQWVNTPSKRETFKGTTPNFSGAFAKVRQELGIKNEKSGW